MTENVLHLVPAEGRNYKDVPSLMQDWEEGKDFKIDKGPYCSIRDVATMKERGYRAVIIRSHADKKELAFAKIMIF